jgi:hypothetical protein
MIQTVEAIIEPDGKVQLLEDVQLTESRRALVTILEDEPRVDSSGHGVIKRAGAG